ncbi:MAG: Trm112 family protein [Candidatus Nanopelagicales bacterium]
MEQYPNSPLGLSPHLRDVLACPCSQHAKVEADEDTGEIVCTSCSTRFPVREGIPVMLLDEATPGPNGVGTTGV